MPVLIVSACALAVMIMVYSQNAALSQDPPGAFPDGLQDSYPSLNWHHCQARARLQGIREWGLGTFTLSQDKGATFGGHLSVLGPAVLSPNWGISTFVIFKNLARCSKI